MPVAHPAFDYVALDAALRVPVAEVRAATDSVKDPYGGLLDLIAQAQAKGKSSSATAPSDAPAAAGLASLSGMSPWLIDTMQIIDVYRQTSGSGADDPLTLETLCTAEMLASLLADIPPRRRPHLNIDPDGRPSFATALDDFYINLTVDEPNLLTRYAMVRGAEHFDEGVAFDGRKLPADLKGLFSL